MLLLDEPTEGIQPSIIKDIARRRCNEIRKMRGITIVVSEQVLSFALDVADRVFVIEGGRLVHETAARDVDADADQGHTCPSEPHLPSTTQPQQEHTMPETLIKVDLDASPPTTTRTSTTAGTRTSRWSAGSSRATISSSRPIDWTGGFIKNNDSADDVRDIDLSIVHFLSRPDRRRRARSPATCWWSTCSTSAPLTDSLWGFNGFFSKKNGGGFLTDHFPLAQKSIWDFNGMYTTSRHVPGVELRRPDPPRPDRLPARSEDAGDVEQAREGA